MGVSKNRGTPKSSILIGVSIINYPFWGYSYVWKHPYQPVFSDFFLLNTLQKTPKQDRMPRLAMGHSLGAKLQAAERM